LAFLCALLAYSDRFAIEQGKRHKPLPRRKSASVNPRSRPCEAVPNLLADPP
jgi:hypothetical protein